MISVSNLPGPKWLNLEYVYAKILGLLTKLPDIIFYILGWFGQYFLKIVSVFLAAVFAVLIAIILIKFYRLKSRKKIKASIKFAEEESLLKSRSGKWGGIKIMIDSENPEDWKKAIVAADAILDEIFGRMGFKADGLGEKLKSVEPSDFLSMQEVWEAYKIRSRIAKEGAGFELSQEEAKETLAKYEKGLKELGYL